MTTVAGRAQPANHQIVPMLLAAALGGLIWLFRDSLGLMLASGSTLRQSHGWLVPGLVLALLYLHPAERAELPPPAAAARSAWLGPLLLLASAGLLVFGELGAIYTLSQIGFVVALWGLLLSATGLQRLRWLWLPCLCLLFMVPLPQFLSNQLHALLQLVAAQAGALLIRAAGFAVVLEGNLLDVGAYRIPVTEACSSVQMFLPLLSLALPAAVLWRGGWGGRLLLLAAAPLIPILAGSLRIVVTAALARSRGIEAAERFLQASGGVPLYLACVALLVLLIWWLGRRGGRSMASAWDLARPGRGALWSSLWPARPSTPLWTALLLIAVLALVSAVVDRPELQRPERQRFAFFPRQIADWQARTAAVDPVALASLKLADHLSLVWQRPADSLPVSLWVAWYDVQVYGASIHSPMACLPGAGWRVEAVGRHVLPGAGPGGGGLPVNRAVIALGSERQLVYYWFAQRGRALSSEYLLKWYLFQDSLLMQRSDGALIRITTPLPDLADTAAADGRLSALVHAITPVLGAYVPGAEVPVHSPILNKP
jgi:exosortase D (VPLPA-CTERM-specific)